MTGHLHRPGPGPGRDSKTDLLDAARAAIKDREEAAVAAVAAANAPQRRKRRLGIMALVGVVGIFLLILQPDWLVGPEVPPPEPPGVATASLRLTMLRERDRVFAFQKRFGRLPAALADAGVETPWLEYQRVGTDGFTLQAQVGDSVLVLTAGDSLPAFLGNSLRVLQGRGRP